MGKLGLRKKTTIGRILTTGTSIVITLAVLGVPNAVGATLHEFNPRLSLTGRCKTSSVDPVPDPSCPSGPLPSLAFSEPKSIATDSYGNIYVASYGDEPFGQNGRIDIFTSNGFYIPGSEIADPNGPRNLVVDSKGYLYVFDFASGGANEIMRYKPTVYNPAAGEITYGSPPVLVTHPNSGAFAGLGINVVDDHLFVNNANRVIEYKSAEENNGVITEKIGKGVLNNEHGIGLAVDSTHKRIYTSDSHKVRVFELEEPYNLLITIEGSATPSEAEFSNFLSVAVDENTGHFFIYDGNGTEAAYEFDEEGKYVETINHEIEDTFGNEITVDNGANSPNGAENPFGHFLYIPSRTGGTGHSFAFGPPEPKAPEVEALSTTGVTETEAKLQAMIKPEFLETLYMIEYTTLEAFEGEVEKFESATLAEEGTLPANGSPFEASASLKGLVPGTTYVFRVVAENEKGKDEAVSEFATFPAIEAPSACANEAFRIGPSELLPDCRAYELVTPPDTNGRAPLGVGFLGSVYFATLGASPDGDAATFEIEGGTIPGYEGTGSYAGDPYVVHRTKAGWQTEYAGPSPTESPELLPGSNSPDQGYSFWRTAGGNGSASIGEKATTYVRYPDGHSELVGRGSLTTDPRAQGDLIAEDGSHIIFTSGSILGPAIRLEEDAPPDGTITIYDRTIDLISGKEQTHVVSLLPEDEPAVEGENAFYEGASLDGKAVAFRIGGKIPEGPLYFRYNNEETYEAAPASATFAGFAKEGKRLFYLEGGNLEAFDIEGGESTFSSSGNVTPVNVAPEGKVAYFVSPSVLVSEPNPAGDLPVGGEQNLYRSEEGILSFVGTVTKADVEGQGEKIHVGLGVWTEPVARGTFGRNTSRVTPDGQVLLFESEANLTGYDPQGHHEVYRYDLAGNELECLSCSPTLAPAVGAASLQSISQEQGAPEPGSFFVLMNNLRDDGNRAIFQSTESLVLDDTDGLQDVYEWEAQGIGSCKEAGGCVYLISSGHSRSINYLWAVSDSGSDVFFRSGDLLTGSDKDETPSIYDARVEGGFAEPVKKEPCQGEGCLGGLTSPPVFPPPASPPLGVSGNVKEAPCPKGKHKATRNGETVCVKNKKKHHKKHHRRAGSKRRGAGK